MFRYECMIVSRYTLHKTIKLYLTGVSMYKKNVTEKYI